MTSDTTTKAVLSTLLMISIVGNGALFMKLRDAENYIDVLVAQNRAIGQSAKDLTKDKTGLEATLAECNDALAAIQAKPLPVVTCPALAPTSVCPATPACPSYPPPTVCTCAPVFSCAEPAKIDTAVPAVKEARKHVHHHRRHHFHSLAAPECEAPRNETF
jgi:hypothetical protein